MTFIAYSYVSEEELSDSLGIKEKHKIQDF